MQRASSWMDPRPKVSEKIQIMSSTKYHGPRMASLSFLHGSMLLYFNLYYTSTYLLSKLISEKESFNLFYEMLLIPPRCYRFTPKIQDEEALQTLGSSLAHTQVEPTQHYLSVWVFLELSITFLTVYDKVTLYYIPNS